MSAPTTTPATATANANATATATTTSTSTSTTAPARRERVWRMAELRQLRDAGKIYVVIRGGVYHLPQAWTTLHPGGPKVLQHVASTDVTDTVLAFHPPAVIETMMARFAVGVLDPRDDATPPISLAYRALHADLTREGFFAPTYGFYVREFLKCGMLLALAVAALVWGPASYVTYTASALAMAALWHQAAFIAHDIGHQELTGRVETDRLVGILLADLCGGLSLGWWKHNHNVHHVETNDPEHDPDIQHLPFFAVTTRLFNNLYSSYYNRVMPFDGVARAFVRHQHKLYHLVLSFGRFNLYVQGFRYLLGPWAPHRGLELTCLALFWLWFTTLLRTTLPTWPALLYYVWLSHAATMFLHLQITLSHFGMNTDTPPNEDFVSKVFRTTMDVACPPWMDWFHGGLQFQIEHHLFPRLPRARYRAVQPRAVALARQFGCEFHNYGFVEGNRVVLGVMGEVARQVGHVMATDPKKALAH
ncbi:hypothetical protein CXG81DRAFT_15487 [Caulochytrium protostelioides]|uniref:Cytochrome b5 heme-binding domain-containing protein n=1 Tax=Caulochytrium protostelioides TaxID=1555241 RepID=A0A4P9WYY8_9FUNG|nr:hypothetical protein CXG81DRAFT_15487 [Caulochytrium protostelioides]|eukprot:RKO98759.1 hypothetical protein CXG81DRAFT_15487 [Caulochytrium protostelioides]